MEAPICRNCKAFFGCQEGLCSKCFKEAKSPPTPYVEFPIVPDPTTVIVEETKEIQPVQSPDKCSLCSKKLGPVSFQCKCANYFCTRHRLPEEHLCTFDHKSAGIRKLSEENPVVQAPKFNKL